MSCMESNEEDVTKRTKADRATLAVRYQDDAKLVCWMVAWFIGKGVAAINIIIFSLSKLLLPKLTIFSCVSIMVRSLHSFSLTCLLRLTLTLTQAISFDFKMGPVLAEFLSIEFDFNHFIVPAFSILVRVFESLSSGSPQAPCALPITM